VREACTDLAAAALVGELAVEPLRIDGEPDLRYVGVTLARLQLSSVTRRIREVKSRLQRLNPVTSKDAYLTLAGELFSLEQHARALREQASRVVNVFGRSKKLARIAGAGARSRRAGAGLGRLGFVGGRRHQSWPVAADATDRLGWHEIHKATWVDDTLTVIGSSAEPLDGFALVSDRPPISIKLAEPA